MHGAAERPADFDVAVRDQIRRKLHHYMRAHRIGVPKLAHRICEALPRRQKIPVKTLQNFLAGRRRTGDAYVGLFDQFTSGLPEPDPIGQLGKAMAELFTEPSGFDYTGDYTTYFHYFQSDEMGPPPAALSCRPDDRFYRIVEKINLPVGIARCEGVLVPNGNAAILNLIDPLTFATKTYHVFGTGSMLPGQGIILHPRLHPTDLNLEPRMECIGLGLDRQNVAV